MSKYMLAGDIGGSKTNIAVFVQEENGAKTYLAQSHYLNCNYLGIVPIVRRFFDEHGIDHVHSACFSVAGAVNSGISYMPNLAWLMNEDSLAEELELHRVFLINDLVATAYGICELSAEQCITLNVGEPDAHGNKALLAAGTGLGEAILFETEHGMHVAASEGGHADFAPNSPLQADLWRYLSDKFGHVSIERVLSGNGLCNIYEFLRDSGQYLEVASLSAEMSADNHASAAIAMHALRKESPLCEATLHHFVAIYGAEAGNLALKALATGGIYIAGGIASQIIDALSDGTFVAAFLGKGRFRNMLADMPIKMIIEPKTALFGAAVFVAQHQ